MIEFDTKFTIFYANDVTFENCELMLNDNLYMIFMKNVTLVNCKFRLKYYTSLRYLILDNLIIHNDSFIIIDDFILLGGLNVVYIHTNISKYNYISSNEDNILEYSNKKSLSNERYSVDLTKEIQLDGAIEIYDLTFRKSGKRLICLSDDHFLKLGCNDRFNFKNYQTISIIQLMLYLYKINNDTFFLFERSNIPKIQKFHEEFKVNPKHVPPSILCNAKYFENFVNILNIDIRWNDKYYHIQYSLQQMIGSSLTLEQKYDIFETFYQKFNAYEKLTSFVYNELDIITFGNIKYEPIGTKYDRWRRYILNKLRKLNEKYSEIYQNIHNKTYSISLTDDLIQMFMEPTSYLVDTYILKELIFNPRKIPENINTFVLNIGVAHVSNIVDFILANNEIFDCDIYNNYSNNRSFFNSNRNCITINKNIFSYE